MYASTAPSWTSQFAQLLLVHSPRCLTCCLARPVLGLLSLQTWREKSCWSRAWAAPQLLGAGCSCARPWSCAQALQEAPAAPQAAAAAAAACLTRHATVACCCVAALGLRRQTAAAAAWSQPDLVQHHSQRQHQQPRCRCACAEGGGQHSRQAGVSSSTGCWPEQGK